MRRYLSALCVSLLGVGAFAGASAQSASAVIHHFTCSLAPCIVTGEQYGEAPWNVFGIKNVAGTISCKKGTYAGTVESPGVTALTLHPTYHECSAFGSSATVDTAGCNYILTGETDKFINTEGKEEGEDATMDLECTGENVIKLTTSAGCTITFKPQEKRLGVKYTNVVGTPNHITVRITIDKIKFHTNKAFACAIAGIPNEGENGFLTKTVTLKAYEDNGNPPCPELPDNYTTCEGEQIGLTIS